MARQREKVFSKNSRLSSVIQRRSDFKRRRKNFFPTFVLAILFWLGWIFVLFKIPPEPNLSFLAFFLFLFLAVFLASALLFANSKQGFVAASFVIFVLLFRYYQIGNLLNLFLLLTIFIALEFFFFTKRV